MELDVDDVKLTSSLPQDFNLRSLSTLTRGKPTASVAKDILNQQLIFFVLQHLHKRWKSCKINITFTKTFIFPQIKSKDDVIAVTSLAVPFKPSSAQSDKKWRHHCVITSSTLTWNQRLSASFWLFTNWWVEWRYRLIDVWWRHRCAWFMKSLKKLSEMRIKKKTKLKSVKKKMKTWSN